MKRIVMLGICMLAGLFAFQSLPPSGVSALPAGLVAAYSFDEGGGTTTTDLSGLNNHGTLSGPSWTTSGRYGGALSFDGINDLVSVADSPSLDLTTGMTMSAWVRPTTLSGWKSIVLKARPGNLAYALYANTGANRPAGEIWTNSTREARGAAKLSNNTWTYLTTTYNGSQLRLYVNGSLVRTVNTSGAITISGNALTIGGNGVWNDEFFSGIIDEVRVYNRALSAAEIISDRDTALVASDATVPTVSITSPAAGATVSGSVSITANAADNVGVAGVEFLVNGLAAGAEDTTAPYSYAWNTNGLTNGSYALTARARDAAGNQTTSTAVNVIVNNADATPPTVSVTAPADGATVSGSVSITANAADNVGIAGVQFLVNGVAAGAEDTAAPYSYTWSTTSLTNGSYALTARARDAAGNQTTSTAVNVIVNNADATPPTVSITSPSAGATVSGSVSITANAADNIGIAGVQFLVNGVAAGAEDTAAPYSYAWSTTGLTNGSYALTARARDAAGNQTTSTAVNVIVNNADATPPTVSVTAPADGATVSGSVSITANAADNVGVAGVEFLVNGVAAGAEDTTAPYSTSWDATGLPAGSYALAARARDAAGNQSTSTAVNVTLSVVDTLPPTVAITSPAAGANVSGDVGVAANASDDVAVVGVQFKLDGVNLGAEDTAAPYTALWSSNGATSGNHTLTAVARDASGKSTTSPPIVVGIVNPNSPDQVGEWTPLIDLPMVAVHTTLLPNGNVLMWDAWEHGTTQAKVWNLLNNTFTSVPIASQIFCAAQSYLPDGRILVTGGHDGGGTGIKDASIFNPLNSSWTRIADMEVPRWYPTNVTLRDGRVAVIGGEIVPGLYADFAEVYNPYTDTWETLEANTSTLHDTEYPLAYLLPDNRIFVISITYGTSHILDVDNDTWTDMGAVARKASAATYAPGKIMYAGGGCPDCPPAPTTMIIDFNQASPRWRAVEPMHYGRFNHSLVPMPDGNVMAIGGATIIANVATTGVLTPEIWDPTTESWKLAAPQAQPRLYHSTAMLLHDGRILSAGGGRWSTAIDYPTAEIYSPPYLFKGPRPVISNAPTTAGYGDTFTITTPDAADIASVALVGLPAVTHTIDMNQHYVPLAFTRTAGALQVTIPTNAAEATPGPYMLFILNADGVPSVATNLSLALESETTLPSVAMTLPVGGATVSGTTVRLETTASDDSGVATVEFFAGAMSLGFATASNPYSITWNSTTVANGPVALTAVATDIFGNTKTSTPVNVTVNNTAVPPAAGLVLALGFNEGGGTTANDSSALDNDGAVAGPVWGAGKYGQGLSFDGVDDWVTVADDDSLDLTSGLTVSAWVRPNALSSWKTIVLKERPGHLAYALYGNAGSSPSAEIFTASSYVANGAGLLPLLTWSHLTMTYDGVSLRLYINGALVSTSPGSGNVFVSGSPLRIGGNGTWGDEFFSGLIDEVRVYNRALTLSEVQTDMNTPIP